MSKGRRSRGAVKDQRWLPFVPEDLAGLGLKGCDRAPRCSKGREASFRDVLRRPGPVAWTYPHVQHHGTNDYTGVYLDVDRSAGDLVEAVDGGAVPQPSVMVTRAESGHSHCAWLLAAPVHRHPEAGARPLKLFARTAEYFADAVGADPDYTSVLFRNGTVHVEREGWIVLYGGPPGGWTLYELADWIPESWRRPRQPLTAEGRNCALFTALCRFAGSRAGRTADLSIEAARLNRGYGVPLPDREVHHVVASVSRYRARWEAGGWHRPAWLARQAARRKRGVAAQRAAWAALAARAASMRSEGVPVDEIARAVGRSRRTVYEWLARRKKCG